MFKDHLKLNDSDFVIQGTWRIGKVANDPAQKPRLVKVILDRKYMIGTILKATKYLTSSSDQDIKKISIFKDLINEDRVLRKKLIADMKAKNELLKNQNDPDTGNPVTDRWVIRNDKVILVDKDFKPKSI